MPRPRTERNEYACRLDLDPGDRPDGDTVRLRITFFDDQEARYEVVRKIRLVAGAGQGLNAPERKGGTLPAGNEARDYLLGLFEDYGRYGLICRLYGLDKYGRLKTQIVGEDDEGIELDFGERLVTTGHAVYEDYD